MVMTGHNNDLHTWTYFGVDDYYWTVFFSILLLFYAGMDKQPKKWRSCISLSKQWLALQEVHKLCKYKNSPEILAFWKQLIQLGSLGAAKPKQKQLLTASTVYQSIKLCGFNQLVQSNQLNKIMYFLNVFFIFAISPA